MEKTKIQQLIKTLSHFGLNPKDWKVNLPLKGLKRELLFPIKEKKTLTLLEPIIFIMNSRYLMRYASILFRGWRLIVFTVL